MFKLKGYWHKIAIVNLTDNIIRKIKVKDEIFKKYLGGVGLATWLFYNEIKDNPNIDPFAPENPLILATGPYQGTPIPGSGRGVFVSKSPLTGIWGESNIGGDLAFNLKTCGLDAIIIKGKAKKPCLIYVSEGNIEILDAEDYWGLKTSEAEEEIRKDYGRKISVACIGPAGERLVRFACIKSGHGRCGLGAVMGSKMLKAIVIERGSLKVEVYNYDDLVSYSRELARKMYEKTKDLLRKYGTLGGIEYFYNLGYSLVEYWKKHDWNEVKGLSGDEFLKIIVKPVACINCPIACHKHTRYKNEFSFDCYGPEYETAAMIGWLNKIGNAKAVAYIHHLCNEYGIDGITTGALIGLTIRLYEEKLISKNDLVGLEPKWGDPEFAINLIEIILERKGFGKILAGGVNEVKKKFGNKVNKILVECKGLDVPAHDPRYSLAQLLSYVTSNRGACHMRGFVSFYYSMNITIPEWGLDKVYDRYDVEKAPLITVKFQNYATILNSLVQCAFTVLGGFGLKDAKSLLYYVTGYDFSFKELEKIAERIYALQRLINMKFGLSRKDDYIPEYIAVTYPKINGKSIRELFSKLLEEYYALRGWDLKGKPTLKTLRKLEVEA